MIRAAIINYMDVWQESTQEMVRELRVEKILEVDELKTIEEFRRNFHWPYVIVVNNDVREMMYYNEDKGIITNEFGTQVYPPLTPDESLAIMKEALDELTFNVDTNKLNLEELQDYLIKKNKKNLEDYLLNHPMKIDNRTYTVTSDKQAQLTGVLNAYNYARNIGITIPLTWNETNRECEPYTYEQLVQLYLNMLNYVKPIITYQQHIETRIRESTSINEILNLDINFRNYVAPNDINAI